MLGRYFDSNATTPIEPAVIKAMTDSFSLFGNPSSQHKFGSKTKAALISAREQTAQLIGCEADEIIFTASGTEANNLAIKGYLKTFEKIGGHIISSAIEHPSILRILENLEKNFDVQVTYLPVDYNGIVNSDVLLHELRPDTKLISVMFVNNETGAIQPINKIAKIAQSRGIFFHCDGVQAVGKIPVDVKQLGIDSLSLSGHKFNAPKGVGALFLKSDRQILPIIHGGGQERGLRGGTENTTLIIGLAEACRLAKDNLSANAMRISTFKSRLLTGLQETLADITVNGTTDENFSIPNTLNISIHGIRAEALMAFLSEKYHIGISIGSACSSNKQASLSHVLSAMGLTNKEIRSAVRISLGNHHTEEDIVFFIQAFCESVQQLRSFAPKYAMT